MKTNSVSCLRRYGQVDRVSIMTDRDTGRSRGFGFVEMASNEDGEKAITASTDRRSADARSTSMKPAPRLSADGGGGGGGGGRTRSRRPRRPRRRRRRTPRPLVGFVCSRCHLERNRFVVDLAGRLPAGGPRAGRPPAGQTSGFSRRRAKRRRERRTSRGSAGLFAASVHLARLPPFPSCHVN